MFQKANKCNRVVTVFSNDRQQFETHAARVFVGCHNADHTVRIYGNVILTYAFDL